MLRPVASVLRHLLWADRLATAAGARKCRLSLSPMPCQVSPEVAVTLSVVPREVALAQGAAEVPAEVPPAAEPELAAELEREERVLVSPLC